MAIKDFNYPDQYGVGQYVYKRCGGAVVTNNVYSYIARRNRGLYRAGETPLWGTAFWDGILKPVQFYRRTDVQFVNSPGLESWFVPCAGVPEHHLKSGLFNHSDMPGWEYSQGLHEFSPFELVDTQALTRRAEADLLPQLDALTSAVELHKTMDMVRDVHADAKRLIRQALRGGKHTVKAAAEAWLAWRYGWNTLGQDISAVHEALTNPRQSLIVRGRAGESFNDVSTGDLPPQYFYHLTRKGEWRKEYDISVRASVVAHANMRSMNAFADPFVTAWEEVPFSFVADWFVDVGTSLKAWKARCSVAAAFYSIGYRLQVKVKGRRWSTKGYGVGCYGTSGDFTSSASLIEKCRIPVSAPSLVPSFTVDLNTKRILDTAALLSRRINTHK
jgi:hypothetical protein